MIYQVLNDNCPAEVVQQVEKQYNKELQEQNVTNHTHFQYSLALIRSEYEADIRKGVTLLEDLTLKHVEGRLEYIFYLAVGHARLKNYTLAMKYCKTFEILDPTSVEIQDLQDEILKKMYKGAIFGLTLATGAAFAFGGLIGLVIVWFKKR